MRTKTLLFSIVLIIILGVGCSGGKKKSARSEDRIPSIYPDYSSLIIPVNIAPLNFIIREEADEYSVFFSDKRNNGFKVHSANGKVLIPFKKWKYLLSRSIGDTIQIEVSAKKDKEWITYRAIKNYVSPDSLDAYLVYRRINPALILWNDMAIVQRNTESFKESAILENRNTNGNCMHCHTFQNHNPEKMMFHLRTPPGGTYIKSEDTALWLETKTPYTLASFAYSSWNPVKNYIAFSTNVIHQLMYASGERLNYVYDDKSDILIYDVDKNMVFTSPKISGSGLENLPNWSPDGKTLYYIYCPPDRKETEGKRVRYDLMRISFNPATHEWGDPDTLLSSSKTGLSITFPEASPDGRFIAFCMADYGYFTIGNNSSDLYILDLQDKSYRKLDINSNQTESFHNWSYNSRWLVFASKREDGIITLPYFSHIDAEGKESKPFVLPAKDPESLLTRFYNFNRPVLVNGKVNITQDEIISTITNQTRKVVFDTTCLAVDSIPPAMITGDHDESSIYQKN